MSGIKLTYFNARGRAEPTRLILAQAGVEYEDVRLDGDQWQVIKPNVAMGQMPFLEVDGKTIAQSMTIARFCAKRYGLAGKTDLEAALADQAVDAAGDLMTELIKVFFEKDEAKKAELGKVLKEEKLPKWLAMMEGVLTAQGGKYFSGAGLTWGDIVIYNQLDGLKERMGEPPVDKFPNLNAHLKMVANLPNIKKWVESRPVTQM